MGGAVMSGQLLNIIRCPETRRVMRAALDQGWEWIGYTKSGHVEIRWPATDALLHCATTPSDRNALKQFARNIEQVSGVVTYRKGNHRRSKKSTKPQVDPQIAASRRRYAATQAEQAAAREAAELQRRRQAAAAEASRRDDQHVRDIASLMRPGNGR